MARILHNTHRLPSSDSFYNGKLDAYPGHPFPPDPPLLPAADIRRSGHEPDHSRRMERLHAARRPDGDRLQALPGRHLCLPEQRPRRHLHGLPGDADRRHDQFHPDRYLQRRYREPPFRPICLYGTC